MAAGQALKEVVKQNGLALTRWSRGATLFIFFLIVFLSFTRPVQDPDTSWHLKTGEYILQQKAIPSTDPFSYADDPLPFIGKFILTQYWLSQVIFFLVYKGLGPFGLVLLRAAMLTTLTALIWHRIREKGIYISFALSALFVYFMMDFQGDRPQLFTFLFSGIVITLFEQYRTKRDLRLLLPLPALMPLWANLHGGFIYGVVLVLIYTLSELLRQLPALQKEESLQERYAPDTRRLLMLAGISVVLSMANPNTFRAFLYAFTTHADNLFTGIAEYYSPLQMMKMGASPIVYGFWTYTAGSLLMMLFFIKERRVAPLLLLIFAVLPAAVSMRYIPLLAIVATAMAGHLPGRLRIPRALRAGGPVNITVLLLAAAFILLFNPLYNRDTYRFNNSPFYAVSAVEFLEHNHISGNIFASYNKSSFLMFRLFPQSRLYSDSRFLSEKRMEVIERIERRTMPTDELIGIISRLMPDGMSAIRVSGTPKAEAAPDRTWSSTLDEIKADIVVHEAVNIYTGEIYPLVFNLVLSDAWKLIYVDGNAMIFVRNIDKYRAAIGAFRKPKALIYGEILAESLATRDTPGHYTTVALARLLKGKADRRTLSSIERALALNPQDVLAQYCKALYQYAERTRKQGGQ